jgi:hypothetical protein
MTERIPNESLRDFFRILLLPYGIFQDEMLEEELREHISDCIYKHFVRDKGRTRERYTGLVRCIAGGVSDFFVKNQAYFDEFETTGTMYEELHKISTKGQVFESAITALRTLSVSDLGGDFMSETYRKMVNAYPMLRKKVNRHLLTLSFILGGLGALQPLSQVQTSIETQCSSKSTMQTCRELEPETMTVRKGKFTGMKSCTTWDYLSDGSCCEENCGDKEMKDTFLNRYMNEPGRYKTVDVSCSVNDVENAIPFLSDCWAKTVGDHQKSVWMPDKNAEFVVTSDNQFSSCIPSTGEASYPLQEGAQTCSTVCDRSDYDKCASGVQKSHLLLAASIPLIMLAAATMLKWVNKKEVAPNPVPGAGNVVIHFPNGDTRVEKLSEILSSIRN